MTRRSATLKCQAQRGRGRGTRAAAQQPQRAEGGRARHERFTSWEELWCACGRAAGRASAPVTAASGRRREEPAGKGGGVGRRPPVGAQVLVTEAARDLVVPLHTRTAQHLLELRAPGSALACAGCRARSGAARVPAPRGRVPGTRAAARGGPTQPAGARPLEPSSDMRAHPRCS